MAERKAPQRNRTPILDEVRSTSELQWNCVRGMSYGRSGVGKTMFCGTFPKPLFLSPITEGGIVSLSGRDIDFLEIGGSDDLLRILEELLGMGDHVKWKTLILDSVTIYCEQFIDELLERKRKASPNNTAEMHRRDWGLLDSHLRTVVDLAHRLPMHVWWVALEDHEKDEESGRIVKGFPMLYGKRAEKMIASMDFIFYHDVIKDNKGEQYRVHTKPWQYYTARARHSNLPSPIRPDFRVLAKHLGLET